MLISKKILTHEKTELAFVVSSHCIVYAILLPVVLCDVNFGSSYIRLKTAAKIKYSTSKPFFIIEFYSYFFSLKLPPLAHRLELLCTTSLALLLVLCAFGGEPLVTGGRLPTSTTAPRSKTSLLLQDPLLPHWNEATLPKGCL